MVWQRDNQFCRTRNGEAGGVQEGLPVYYLNHSNRPVRTRMPGGVGGAQLIMAAPYADCLCQQAKMSRLPHYLFRGEARVVEGFSKSVAMAESIFR